MIKRAANAFLDRHPAIDPAAAQWQAQRAMMTQLATGGRLGVAIGVAGAGKSTALAPLVHAWKEEGRNVFGITLAWRQAGDLGAAGIEERAAVAAFIRRVEGGQYALDRNSVIVVDEVGQLGTRQLLELLRVQQRTGAQVVMVGDPKQCQSIEAGPVIDLLRNALGEDAIPQILTSIRQKTEREREITSLFRAGKAAEALTWGATGQWFACSSSVVLPRNLGLSLFVSCSDVPQNLTSGRRSKQLAPKSLILEATARRMGPILKAASCSQGLPRPIHKIRRGASLVDAMMTFRIALALCGLQYGALRNLAFG